MHVQIGFSGPAGSGVNSSGLRLADLLADHGYAIRADKEYASVIKGENNCFFLSISDQEEYFLPKKVDFFVAFDDYAIAKNQDLYTLQNIINISKVSAKHKNTFAFGIMLSMLNISLEIGEKYFKKLIKEERRAENLPDLGAGYAYGSNLCENDDTYHTSFMLQRIAEPKAIRYGNQLVTQGAIQSGLSFYSAYPMTPASSIADTILEYPEVTFFQGEDEIAVAMAMLGAKFAGARAMCATSGGGFALMTESISFSNQAEIGGVYILSQRDGPSTGTPTFTAQGDLNYALNASFGDTSPIVLAPSTFAETHEMISRALNRSDIYQHPVVFLMDKQISEGYQTILPKQLTTVPIHRGKTSTTLTKSPLPPFTKGGGQWDTFLRYQDTPDGISPYALPGQENTLFIASSYEHDESGASNEVPEIKIQQMQKKFKKLTTFSELELEKEGVGYEIINPQAEKFFITRGINRYNIEHLIKNKSERGLIVLKVMHPFPQKLKEFFQTHSKQIKKLIFVEMNFTGQLQQLTCNECALSTPEWEEKISHYRKYSLYPIYLEELEPLIE